MLPLLNARNAGIAMLALAAAAGGYFAYKGEFPFISADKRAFIPEYVINEIPLAEQMPVPALDREVKFAPGTPEAVKKTVLLNVAELTERLKKSTLDFDAWLSLGSVYKIAGDYEGARAAWEYASAVSVSNYPSFINLGDLYQHYLKDYPKAEASYLRAIANERTYIDGYRLLYELYRYAYKAKEAEAPKVLLKGMAANPTVIDLPVLLAGYYKEKGDKANAVIYYQKALALAENVGDAALVAGLKAEIGALQ